MIARLTPYKRYDLLISALPLILEVIPGVRVIELGESFGDDDYAQELRDRIKALGLGDLFSFVPFQDDVKPFYVAADVLVLCSDGEPLARSVIEALSMETPVVVTDSGGSIEIVRHDETGLIARSGSARSIADCITASLIHRDRSVERARAGRAFVEANLSGRRVAERTMMVYDSVLRT